jgi:hypothetical protein
MKDDRGVARSTSAQKGCAKRKGGGGRGLVHDPEEEEEEGGKGVAFLPLRPWGAACLGCLWVPGAAGG